MPDRTIVWGDPADAGTKYRTQDDASAGGGNFVIVEDLDGNTVLLQWNPTAGQFEYQGPVDMGGNDLNNVGAATVDALEADSLNNADLANAAADTVPVAQGDGTLAIDRKSVV